MSNSHEKIFPVFLTGKVVHGKALGRTVGMPTANVEICDENLLPECGVYATRIKVGEETHLAVSTKLKLV